jgi:oxygen-independent coproporphyrinogen-3 oxidase
LSELQSDGLVEINGNVIEITDQGKPFVRNIAMCLDERYWEVVPQENLFSKSV